MATSFPAHSKIAPQSLKFLYQMHHISPVQTGALEHHPEEVGVTVLRLVRHHHGAVPDHALLHLGGHPVQSLREVRFRPAAPQTGGHIPKANVGVFGLRQDHFKAGPCLYDLREESESKWWIDKKNKTKN